MGKNTLPLPTLESQIFSKTSQVRTSPWFNGGPLIPPHFKNPGTLAVDTFIDNVGQNWFGIARLGTPLQQTAVQRGPLPRWPQLSRVAWARENVSVFQVINRRCPATLYIVNIPLSPRGKLVTARSNLFIFIYHMRKELILMLKSKIVRKFRGSWGPHENTRCLSIHVRTKLHKPFI